ncbi:MAG: HAD family hydrolase [Bacteroidota bacterium]
MIKVITFDLWDTVFIDDSDEPKRKAEGRLSKRDERRQLVFEYANKHKKVSKEHVDIIYKTVDTAFRKVWQEQFITWQVADRLEIIFKGLDVELSADEMSEIVRRHEEMELEFKPDFIEGVAEAIKVLHKDYTLAVISDAIFSPGRVLRELLKSQDLLQYFDHFVFSDEIGSAKPKPIVFESVYEKFNIQSGELVHIGDREHNDILGPIKMNSHSILCTAAIDRDSKNTRAAAVFSDYEELPSIIKSFKF